MVLSNHCTPSVSTSVSGSAAGASRNPLGARNVVTVQSGQLGCDVVPRPSEGERGHAHTGEAGDVLLVKVVVRRSEVGRRVVYYEGGDAVGQHVPDGGPSTICCASTAPSI